MLKSFKYLRYVSLTSMLILSLVLPAIVVPSTASAAVQTVTVDLNPNNGTPTYIGSGFLYGLSENGSVPAGALLSDLKPKLFRGGGAGLSGGAWAVGGYNGYLVRFNSVLAQYNRANSLGAKYQILVSDVWGSDGRTIPDNTQPIFPGDNGNWTSWNNFLTQLVNDKKANNMTNARYDIWNEPDGAYFWPRSAAQYSEMWKRSVQLIRSLDANAVIVGPGYGGFNSNQLSSWLDYAKANNVLPNILDWHFSADPVVDVQATQALLNSKNITTITGFSIGEYIWSAEQNAGYTAWYLARLEKSGVLGANHAIWDHCCDQGLLDDILTTNSQKKGQWWTYKGYADMSGTIVGTNASANIDGVSSKDSVKKSALILLGNNGGVTGDIDVSIINFNTATYLIGNGKAHVVVSWINNIDPVAAPVIIQTLDADVVNNAVKVTIPWNNVSDAYTIAITPFDPAAPTPTPTPTPGNVYQAEDASQSGGAHVMTDHTGYTGTGFVAGYEVQGAATSFLVNIASQGNYNVDLRYANGSGSTRTISIYVNGTKIKQTSLANLTNWDTWGTKTEALSLNAGYSTIAYKYDSGDSGMVNLDKITFSSSGTAIPGNIEAESYSAMSGIQTETTTDTGGGLNVGWTDTGDWMDYNVNVQSAGTYTVGFRVASINTNTQLQLKNGAGTVLTTVIVPNTGGWQAWTTTNANVSLTAGSQTIRVYVSAGGFNVNWFNFTSSNAYQAEDAVVTDGAHVMTDHTGYTGTGFVAGYDVQGASTAFTVNAASQGNYNVDLRYANGSGIIRTVSIYVNGTKIRQTSLSNLANWDTWGTKTETLSLNTGNNTIMYKYDSTDNGLINLDKITVSPI